MSGEVVELLADLVRIDSSNPGLVAGAAGEAMIADHVTAWLEHRGFECHRLEATAGRPSVVAVARGSAGGTSLMLNGHLDTVSLESYADGAGLVPTIGDGKLHGRGAYDMKSGVAAMMAAAHAAAQLPHRGDIVLALVADEEFESAGTEEVLRSFTADAAIVVEPSGLDVVVAHRGFVWFEVRIDGVAAHGSRPDLGVDAIAKAGSFLVRLDQLASELASREPHPVLGVANVHASVIRGGEELSSYPASCTIGVERRTLPGETAESTGAELRAILEQIGRADPRFGYSLTTTFERAPFTADPDSRVVASLVRAVQAVTGETPVTRGEPFWTDCALLADAGIPAVLFGVDGGGAHAATEWVDLASLQVVVSTLVAAITDITG